VHQLRHFSFNRPVPKLCQNPNRLGPQELLFEREQLPQVIDNKHFRIELIERLEPVIVIRNQQVASSILAGGSIKSATSELLISWKMGSTQFPNHPLDYDLDLRSSELTAHLTGLEIDLVATLVATAF